MRGGVCAVEWSERAEDAFDGSTVRIDFRRGAQHDGWRVITITGWTAYENSRSDLGEVCFDRSGRKRRAAGYAYQCTGLTHSRTLMPMVDAMLKNAELTLGDIDYGRRGRRSRLIHGPAHRHRHGQGPRLGSGQAVLRRFHARGDGAESPTWTVCSSARWTRGAIRSTTRSLKRKAASRSRPTAPSRSRSWRSVSWRDGGRLCRDGSHAGVERVGSAQLPGQNAVVGSSRGASARGELARRSLHRSTCISQAERERNARLAGSNSKINIVYGGSNGIEIWQQGTHHGPSPRGAQRTIMRDKNTSVGDFREAGQRSGMLITYEATRDLPLTASTLKRPSARWTPPPLPAASSWSSPSSGAGLGLVDGVLRMVPSARVGHIGKTR